MPSVIQQDALRQLHPHHQENLQMGKEEWQDTTDQCTKITIQPKSSSCFSTGSSHASHRAYSPSSTTVFFCASHTANIFGSSKRFLLCKPHSNQRWLLNKLLMCKHTSHLDSPHSPHSIPHNQLITSLKNDKEPIQSVNNLGIHVSN